MKGLLAMTLFSMLICACGARKEKVSMENNRESTTSEVQQTVKRGNGKVLVAYFSVPETDGADASSGASRVVKDGKVMGNTQYVASVISKATGGELFEIKTAYKYPSSHQPIIDAAKTSEGIQKWLGRIGMGEKK